MFKTTTSMAVAFVWVTAETGGIMGSIRIISPNHLSIILCSRRDTPTSRCWDINNSRRTTTLNFSLPLSLLNNVVRPSYIAHNPPVFPVMCCAILYQLLSSIPACFNSIFSPYLSTVAMSHVQVSAQVGKSLPSGWHSLQVQPLGCPNIF